MFTNTAVGNAMAHGQYEVVAADFQSLPPPPPPPLIERDAAGSGEVA